MIQSYVERQGHASINWELQETTLSSASVEQDLEQHSRDQIVGQEEVTVSPLNLPSLPIPPPLPIWDLHHHRDNWSQNDINNQRLVIVHKFVVLCSTWSNKVKINFYALLVLKMNFI